MSSKAIVEAKATEELVIVGGSEDPMNGPPEAIEEKVEPEGEKASEEEKSSEGQGKQALEEEVEDPKMLRGLNEAIEQAIYIYIYIYVYIYIFYTPPPP